MGLGSAVLMFLFNVILPTADVSTDIYLSLKLFTGYRLIKKHPKFGTLSLIPLAMSSMGVTTQWFKTETKEMRNKLKTLPLLILQFYPQWRALRVLYYAKIKKDPRWQKMKEEFEGEISHLGRQCKY